MVIVTRVVLFCAIILFAYFIFKYIFHPKRKLELAIEKQKLYLYDDFNNVRKNFLITNRGVLFEGEKYMGTADQAFRVIHIKIWPHKKDHLHGLSREDFEEIEMCLFERYPFASIEWSSPVKELIKGHK